MLAYVQLFFLTIKLDLFKEAAKQYLIQRLKQFGNELIDNKYVFLEYINYFNQDKNFKQQLIGLVSQLTEKPKLAELKIKFKIENEYEYELL